MTDIEQIHDVFHTAGWSRSDYAWEGVSADELHTTFESEYGVALVFVVKAPADVMRLWKPSESELAKRRLSDRSIGNKDLYLLFIVDAVSDTDLPMLTEMSNDTFVCRKNWLDRRDRPLKAVLGDLGFIAQPILSAADPAVPSADTAATGLPKALLQDLVKRSAASIVDQMLSDDRYGTEGNRCA